MSECFLLTAKVSWAFGYYSEAMAALSADRRLQRSTLHNLLVPTEELGIPLAEAFEDAVGQDAAALFRSVAQGESVDEITLRRMGPMDINFTNPTAQNKELELLRNVLVGKIGNGERRNTLIEILQVAKTSGSLPKEWLVRFDWLENLPKKNSAHFEERMKWAHFQVADSIRVGMESLLKYSFLTLSEHGPMPSHDLAAEVSSSVPSGVNFRNYFFSLASESEDLTIREVQERAVKDGESLHLKLTLLARLWADWSSKTAEMDAAFPPRGHFQTSASEMRFLVSLEDKDAELAVAEFIRHRILLRHLFVAARKLRFQGNNTFQFEYEDGNLIARRGGQVGAAGPRIGTIISFLTQLGLLDQSGLTHLGQVELGDQ